MTVKQKLIAKATELGVTVFKNKHPDYFTVELDAPQGYCFDQDLHMLVCMGWDDAIERLAWGIEKCDKKDCEICQPDTVGVVAVNAQTYAKYMDWELIYTPDVQAKTFYI